MQKGSHILKLTTTLMANTKGEGKGGDPFWDKAETLLYCALIGYIHYEAPKEEQNFATLIEFINAMEVREDDEDFQNPVDLMFEDLKKKKPDHFAVRQYAKFKLASGVVCSKRLLNQAVEKSLRTHNLKPKKGAQVMRKNEKITALYERLSRDDFGKDDDQQRESNSISNQKAMLEEFAARQGFTNIVHFTDDGISGTCFDRPGFLAMMKEVEAGNVEYLCIKDMSRMGRDYLKVGQIMEILRQRGVRLIAINDGVDSARGDDDFTPFRNIMNEYYARDTSRKIRSTFQSKGKSGKHLTGTVIYGYLWNEARDQWLVDPEAAEVVKRMAITPVQITMTIALGRVFNVELSKSAASSQILAVTGTKLGRGVSQVLVGRIPGVGNALNAATAAAVTELLGWAVAENFAKAANQCLSA